MSVITITTFDDPVDTNDDRAEMVRPFVDAYRTAHYRHPGEPEAMIIGDMIANLMHLADRTISELDDWCAAAAIEAAIGHYEAEVEEERLEAVMEDEARSNE